MKIAGHKVEVPAIIGDLATRLAKTFLIGALYGQVGRENGVLPRDVSDSPFYLFGQVAASIIPGIGSAADLRDLGQDAANGKWLNAGLDTLGVLPVVHEFANTELVAKHIKSWTKAHGAVGKVVRGLGKYVLPHVPDKLSIRILKTADGDSVKALEESGKSTDEIIDLAEEGKLKQAAKEESNGGKRLVADGGKSPAEVKKTLGDGKFVEDDLTDADLRHIEENGNPEETLLATKPKAKQAGNGEVIWLETGKAGKGGTGWKHVLEGHERQFYDLPSVSNRNEIKKAIYKTVKNGDTAPNKGGGTIYEYATSSDRAVRVAVADNGYVLTAHPINVEDMVTR